MNWLARTMYPALSKRRRVMSLFAYGGITALAYLLAYLLRFEFRWPDEFVTGAAAAFPLLLCVRLVFYDVFKLTSGRWRFISVQDVLRLVAASTIGSIVFWLSMVLIPAVEVVPRSIILIEWVLTTYLVAGLWITYRTGFEQIRHRRSGHNGSAKRVLIIGAGEAGNMLAREMARFPTGYRTIGFVDDDRAKWGMNLHGLEVFGGTRNLARIVKTERIEELIIAVPSASPAQLRDIVERCETAGLPLKVLPGIAEVLSGEVRLNQLREVQIEDLLGRDPIELELPELAEDLRGRSVLITGAAGSIGSELARQVALYDPGTLVLLDQAETDLFFLEAELREQYPDVNLVPVVGDIIDSGAIEKVFTEHGPHRVFHAAAYKHVPLMEANVREALRNNVVGTWRVADAAGRHGVEKFVLVSTDKAVRPVSVMGASKRLAEMIVLKLQRTHADTTYSAVRFGNVLGSNGSVIPIFKRQIKEGKPLTVTHPDATRYFMTIPEAVQLILQASLLPDLRGRIAMLEMGEPVRIVDLARNLLRLSGLHSNGKNLRYTGLRPGERLHEKLVAPEEETIPTPISKVRIVLANESDRRGIDTSLSEWERALEGGSDALALALLCEQVDRFRAEPADAADEQVPAGAD